MKNITFQHNNRKHPTTLPYVFNKGRPRKFFIFGDSYASVYYEFPNINESWSIKVTDHFNATAYNWGIPGASEQSIFYTFSKNINEERDFTIIFHTHPERTDRFFNLYGLPMSPRFYKKWDDMITFPCLHIYWSLFNYEFKNGKTLISSYPVNDDDRSINHMSPESNTLLANNIIDIIEDMLK